MSTGRRFDLRFFEDALATEIVTRFKFEALEAGGQKITLVEGTHMFVNTIPDQKEIKQSSPTFNEQVEPQVQILTGPSKGILSSTGTGSKQDYSLRFNLRLGTVPELVKQRLEELVNFILENIPGLVGTKFKCNAIDSTARPTVFQRAGDNAYYATATLLFLVVTLN